MSAFHLTLPIRLLRWRPRRDRLMTYNEVMEELSCSRSQLYRLIAEGRLIVRNIGKRAPRITEVSVDAVKETA
jgi:excisionase family DNA binding protein